MIDLIGPWLVFVVFSALALRTNQVLLLLTKFMSFPFRLSEERQHHIREQDETRVIGLTWLGAVGSGFFAVAYTIQRLVW
jgi:hypothetical protein